jgi:hypothetical protein
MVPAFKATDVPPPPVELLMTSVTEQLPNENVELLEVAYDVPVSLEKVAKAIFSVCGVLSVDDFGAINWPTNTSPELTVVLPLRVLMVLPEMPRMESLH